MKKSELQAEIDRLRLHVQVLESRIAALEAEKCMQPYYPPHYLVPVNCAELEGLQP